MKAVKYLFALWAGVLVYTSLSILFGSVGLSAYRQLEMEQEKQQANIENLKQINRELESTMNSLLYDKDTLAIYAREKGYGARQERFIRVVGLGVHQKDNISVGQVIGVSEPRFIPDRNFRIIAFCAGIGLFFSMAIFDFLRFLHGNTARRRD